MVHQSDMALNAYSILPVPTENQAAMGRKHNLVEDKSSGACISCSFAEFEAEKMEVFAV